MLRRKVILRPSTPSSSPLDCPLPHSRRSRFSISPRSLTPSHLNEGPFSSIFPFHVPLACRYLTRSAHDSPPFVPHASGMNSLERHGPLDVTPQIHHLPRDSRNERMSRVFLRIIVTRDSEHQIGRFGSTRYTKNRTREEYPVWAGGG